jgi:hypothetical protein
MSTTRSPSGLAMGTPRRASRSPALRPAANVKPGPNPRARRASRLPPAAGLASFPPAPAAATVPSGAGSHSHSLCGRPAAPRPSATTSARRARSRPCPSPRLVQRCRATRSRIGAPSHSPITSITPAPRRSTAASRCRIWAGGRAGDARPRSRTRRAARRPPAASPRPGRGQAAGGLAPPPASAAAATPNSGTPATAHHAPAAEATAISVRQSRLYRSTATTAPFARPPAGNKGLSAGRTGSIPSPGCRS